MTFQETLDFLYEQLPVFHKIGSSAYKKDLTRTLALLEHLGHPQKHLRCIHIAGTNGKGSTSHLLASILQEAGYKTGLYTSPHIKDFGERIKINGQYIEEDYVIRFVENIRELLPTIQPSFFELTVALAFRYFADQKVDVAVIETGLGGRLDSTNVIHPLLSLITNISFDHMDLLGNTLEQIAFEKAGIIKQQVPVVISERQAEVENVFLERAKAADAPLYFASDLFQVEQTGLEHNKMQCIVSFKNESYEIESELIGGYQVKNIQGVLMATTLLQDLGLQLPSKAIHAGIRQTLLNTGLKGRWQVIGRSPLTICDIAHNEAGIRMVLENLKHTHPSKLHFVLGMVKEKDVSKVLQLLPKDSHYYFTQAAIARALPKEALQAKATTEGLKGDLFEQVNDALKKARQNAGISDTIIVCGSAFLVAEVSEV